MMMSKRSQSELYLKIMPTCNPYLLKVQCDAYKEYISVFMMPPMQGIERNSSILYGQVDILWTYQGAKIKVMI